MAINKTNLSTAYGGIIYHLISCLPLHSPAHIFAFVLDFHLNKLQRSLWNSSVQLSGQKFSGKQRQFIRFLLVQVLLRFSEEIISIFQKDFSAGFWEEWGRREEGSCFSIGRGRMMNNLGELYNLFNLLRYKSAVVEVTGNHATIVMVTVHSNIN